MIRATVKTNLKFEKDFVKHRKAARRACKQAMKDVLSVSKQLVPLDTGDLRSTGKMTSKHEKNVSTYTVSYGGESKKEFTRKRNRELGIVDYAVEQHDIHYYHDNGRVHNYLVGPFNQMKTGLNDRINREIKKEFGK